MEVALKSLAPSVADEKRWDSVIALLTSGPFETLEFKKIFNAYADNIYYESGSEEANAYLLGGAVPRGSSPAGWAILQIMCGRPCKFGWQGREAHRTATGG